MRDAISQEGLPVDEAEVTRVPQSTKALAGKSAETMLKLMSALEDQEDVLIVYDKFVIDDEFLERFSA